MKKKEKYIIAAVRSWNIIMAKAFISKHSDVEIALITDKKKFTKKKVEKIKPKYIFFPHWSWMIPSEIYGKYECVVFHMTDLPFGRGGSPLQNLIVRGLKKTKITAVKASDEVDSGPVYMKKPLSLDGSAEEIYKRCAKVIFETMIPRMIKQELKPVPQKGKAVKFKRRTPFESSMKGITEEKNIYDHIRMLDAEGYPHAYLDMLDLKIEFTDASLKKDGVYAKAKITKVRK